MWGPLQKYHFFLIQQNTWPLLEMSMSDWLNCLNFYALMQMIVFSANDLWEVLSKASSFHLDLGKISYNWLASLVSDWKKKSSETTRPHDFQQIMYVKSSAKICPCTEKYIATFGNSCFWLQEFLKRFSLFFLGGIDHCIELLIYLIKTD